MCSARKGMTWAEQKQVPWSRLARAIGGEFVRGKSADDKSVVKRVNQWTIKLQTYTLGTLDTADLTAWGTATRSGKWVFNSMVAPYVSKDGFRFQVNRKGWFARLWRKLFGPKDDLGYPEFDRRFVVKANDHFKVRALFANATIRELIESLGRVRLEVLQGERRRGSIEGIHILYSDLGQSFEFRTLDRPRSLFNLFEEMLNQLCEIGSASEEQPNVENVSGDVRSRVHI